MLTHIRSPWIDTHIIVQPVINSVEIYVIKTVYLYYYCIRDEELQEQLWEISIERVRDWLSPEILEKYGTRIPSQPNENRRGDNNEQQSGQGTTVQSDSTNKGTTDQSDSAANEPASGDVQENENGDD